MTPISSGHTEGNKSKLLYVIYVILSRSVAEAKNLVAGPTRSRDQAASSRPDLS